MQYMVSNIFCTKCGSAMLNNDILRSDGGKLTQYQCSQCGNCFESGFRYNRLTKQFVKYVRFNT